MEDVIKSDNSKLTDAELKILEICLNPSYSGRPVTEKCKAISVSRDTWYRAFRNPVFTNALNEANIDLVKGRISDVVKACMKFGIKNSKNSADRKLLLTMAGLYTDKQEVNANVTGEIENNIDLRGLSSEEIKELIKNISKES